VFRRGGNNLWWLGGAGGVVVVGLACKVARGQANVPP